MMHELVFRTDLTLSLLSAATENAAIATLDPARALNVAHRLARLDKQLEKTMRRLQAVDDFKFQRLQLCLLVKAARRVLRLALDVAAAASDVDTQSELLQLSIDGKLTVTALARAYMTIVSGR
jgi:hypothetical protein